MCSQIKADPVVVRRPFALRDGLKTLSQTSNYKGILEGIKKYKEGVKESFKPIDNIDGLLDDVDIDQMDTLFIKGQSKLESELGFARSISPKERRFMAAEFAN